MGHHAKSRLPHSSGEAVRKKLIAIMTCHEKRAWADAQRDTWVRDIVAKGYADVRFFLGRGRDPLGCAIVPPPDEVWLDVPDDYSGIPLKVQAICKWAADRYYDVVAKCDDDVYVIPDRFPHLALGPYVGRFRTPYGKVYPVGFASGFFYSMDNEAINAVARTTWNGDWMDERFVATVLAHHGIYGHHDPVNYMVTGPHLTPFDIAGNEAFRHGTAFCEYAPTGMRAMHLTMRHLGPSSKPVVLVPQTPVVVSYSILTSPPDDKIPEHKVHRRYHV